MSQIQSACAGGRKERRGTRTDQTTFFLQRKEGDEDAIAMKKKGPNRRIRQSFERLRCEERRPVFRLALYYSPTIKEREHVLLSAHRCAPTPLLGSQDLNPPVSTSQAVFLCSVHRRDKNCVIGSLALRTRHRNQSRIVGPRGHCGVIIWPSRCTEQYSCLFKRLGDDSDLL